MPNDPKWRTIARISGEEVSLVIAVFVHMLVDASRNVTRGHVCVTAEDLASALDVTDEQISSILAAMEGRVISDGYLSGWEKRQPKKEDVGNDQTGAKSAAERKADQRERERLAREESEKSQGVTPSHEQSRNVTLEKRREEKSIKEANASLSGSTNLTDAEQKNAKVATCPIDQLIDLYEKTLPSMPRVRRSLFKAGKNGTAMRQRWVWVMTSMHERGERAGTRLAETAEQGVAWFERYFAYVADSKFLTEGFPGCDLAWLLAKENFEKVLSGRYENREWVAA